MELLLLFALGAALYFYFNRANKQTGRTTRQSSKTHQAKKLQQGNIPAWLEDKWEHSARIQHADCPDWFIDAPSQRQITYLAELGQSLGSRNLTKGQVSDLIGLHHDPDDADMDVLKFFKQPTGRISQTEARYRVSVLLSDSKKALEWQNRPMSALQKEYFRHFGLKIEAGTNFTAAENAINDHTKSLADDDHSLQVWEVIKDIQEELSDKETREDYNIKKPSVTLIRRAVQQLLKQGKTTNEISNNTDLVVDQMIETHPNIER